MAYTTVADVKANLRGISPQATLDDEFVGYFIARAETKINSKLAARYSVPFSPVPPMVADLATDIAVGLIYKSINSNKEAAGAKSTVWNDAYNSAIESLDKIADCQDKLVDAAGNDVATRSGTIAGNNKDYTPASDMDDETQWNVSQGKLNDINDRRSR